MNKEQFFSQVERYLDEVQGYLAQHGGSVELKDADPETGVISVSLQGACVGCPMADATVQDLIGSLLREKIPAVTEVRRIDS